MDSLLPSALSFLGGFFTALLAEPLRRWIWTPRLKLTFGTSQHFVTRTPEVSPDGQYESMFVRIKVVNSRASLAKSCRAYLVNIERKGTTGQFEPTEYCESLQIAWSSQSDQSFCAFDLPRRVPHFVDVMSTRPTASGFALATKVTPFRYERMLKTPGTYRFTVVVSGDGVKPATIRPTVFWNGVWNHVQKEEA